MKLHRIFSSFLDGMDSAFDRTESKFSRILYGIEYKVGRLIKNIRRKIFRTIIQITVLAASLIVLGAGIILFFLRFFPADAVLIGAGIIGLYIVMMLNWMK